VNAVADKDVGVSLSKMCDQDPMSSTHVSHPNEHSCEWQDRSAAGTIFYKSGIDAFWVFWTMIGRDVSFGQSQGTPYLSGEDLGAALSPKGGTVR